MRVVRWFRVRRRSWDEELKDEGFGLLVRRDLVGKRKQIFTKIL